MKLKSLLTLISSTLLAISGTAKPVKNAHIPADIESKISTLKTSMLDYIKAADPSYTKKDVNKCVDILYKYAAAMTNTHSKEEGMQVVKATVLELNKLNESCNSELIETGERETIAEIIILAGNHKGYNAMDEDITEEWREW